MASWRVGQAIVCTAVYAATNTFKHPLDLPLVTLKCQITPAQMDMIIPVDK